MNKLPLTEKVFQGSKAVDELDTRDALKLMIDEHSLSAKAVEKNIEQITSIVDEIVNKLKNSKNSRLIYVGAGTSGRIGLQDGIELYPTFGWPKKRLDFILAGGINSLTSSIENAEDNILDAEKEFNVKNIGVNDIIIGLAASGNTPFTCRILELSYNSGALTIAISNNPEGILLSYGKMKVILNTKQEVVAGSTRLKAGTSQKICLNTISTMVMIKLGYVKNGRMNNLIATNNKLRQRKLINNNFYSKKNGFYK